MCTCRHVTDDDTVVSVNGDIVMPCVCLGDCVCVHVDMSQMMTLWCR